MGNEATEVLKRLQDALIESAALKLARSAVNAHDVNEVMSIVTEIGKAINQKKNANVILALASSVAEYCSGNAKQTEGNQTEGFDKVTFAAICSLATSFIDTNQKIDSGEVKVDEALKKAKDSGVLDENLKFHLSD